MNVIRSVFHSVFCARSCVVASPNGDDAASHASNSVLRPRKAHSTVSLDPRNLSQLSTIPECAHGWNGSSLCLEKKGISCDVLPSIQAFVAPFNKNPVPQSIKILRQSHKFLQTIKSMRQYVIWLLMWFVITRMVSLRRIKIAFQVFKFLRPIIKFCRQTFK